MTTTTRKLLDIKAAYISRVLNQKFTIERTYGRPHRYRLVQHMEDSNALHNVNSELYSAKEMLAYLVGIIDGMVLWH